MNTRQRNQVDELDPLEEYPDAEFEFHAEVCKAMGRPGMTRQRAVLSVARAKPRLHQAYLLATNPGRRQTRILRDKFDTFPA